MANRNRTPARPTGQPIVFNKLCDLIKAPGIFSDISYEVNDEGQHVVNGVVNDKAFEVSGKNEREAKDNFALRVFTSYGQDKPIKGKLMEAKCVGQMLCWNSLANVRNFRRRTITEFVGDEGSDSIVAAFTKTRTKNEEGKFEFEREELMRATGPSIQDAEFNLGIQMLNHEEYRDQYVAWIKSGKTFAKGWRKPKEEENTEEEVKDEAEPDAEGEGNEMDTTEGESGSPKKKTKGERPPPYKIDWVDTEPEEGEYVTKLREFCENYGLPMPTFLQGTDNRGNDRAQCKIAMSAKDANKEAACKVINDILTKICEEQSARRQEEREALAAEENAKAEEREAERVAKLAATKAEIEEVKGSETLTQGWPMPKGGKPKKEVVAKVNAAAPTNGLAVYTMQMLKDAFGDVEQFPILALNDYIRNNHTGKKAVFGDVVAANGGFNSEAEVDGVKAIGHGGSKKEAKQVSAQALLMTLKSANAAPAEVPAFEMNTSTQPAAPSTPVANNNENPISRVSNAGNIFQQSVNWETEVEVNGTAKSFTTTVTFGELSAAGSGSDKKTAKQNAAAALLPMIEGQFGNAEQVAAERKASKSASKRGRGGARGGRGGKRVKN